MNSGLKVAVIADIHVGAPTALWIPGQEANAAQVALAGYWNEFWGHPLVQGCSYVVNLAESIEGNNRKNFGEGLMSSSIDHQKEVFCNLLKPYLEGRIYLSVSGSGYHGSLDTEIEADIARRLGGHYLGTVANWKPFGTDRLINLAHAYGSPLIYQATGLDREGLFAAASEGGSGEPHTDLIIRGHLHRYLLVQDDGRTIVQAPSWKTWHPIKNWSAKGYFRQRGSRVGGLVIDVSDRITVTPITFPRIPLDDLIKTI